MTTGQTFNSAIVSSIFKRMDAEVHKIKTMMLQSEEEIMKLQSKRETMCAPRKLANGSWSDGVDRTRPLQYAGFYVRNPNRIYVVKLQEQWHPCKGRELLTNDGFRTHAEAIAYVDKLTRRACT